jgi:3-hydroxyisobutyrate dehydrogenase
MRIRDMGVVEHMAVLDIVPGKARLGWIGLGVMGAPMCGHLLDAGFEVAVHTRTAARAQDLLARGARWMETPRGVAEASDVVFSMVGFPHEVREVILGESGALAGCRPGTVLVDMSTSSPALAREIAERAAARGVHAVDAPVSGGDVGAREARLVIMAGGDADVIDALRPVWQRLGRSCVRHGGPGAGQHTKLVNQTLIAGALVGVCEALLYAQRAGLDLERVLETVSGGAAASWQLSNLAPRMLAGDFRPGFFVEHFLKDMALVLEESDRMGLALPGLALVRQLFVALKAQGHGRSGTQALILALATLSNVEWPAR